jgi:hypothetical protein
LKIGGILVAANAIVKEVPKSENRVLHPSRPIVLAKTAVRRVVSPTGEMMSIMPNDGDVIFVKKAPL